MIAAFFDPYVFACPIDATENDIVALISSVLRWRDLQSNPWLTAYISEQTTDCIIKSGCGFPPWQRLKEAIENSTLDVATKDVLALISGLLDRLPRIEDAIGVIDVLVEGGDEQPSISGKRGEVLEAGFHRLLALVCLFIEKKGLEAVDRTAVLSRGLESCPVQLTFSARLADIDPQGAAVVPRSIDLKIDIFQCLTHYLESINPIDIWTSDLSDTSVRDAIEMYTRRAAHQCGAPYNDSWRIGHSLVASIQSLNLRSAKLGQLVLRACAETILGQKMADVHALRTSRAANSDQKRRGRDSAWRRDVDYEYHLHYWSTPLGPELASVVMHNDFSIPE